MNNPEIRRLAATFIVRLWSEHGQDEPPQWRGQVEHIQSDQKHYFRELDKLVEFIASYLQEQDRQTRDQTG